MSAEGESDLQVIHTFEEGFNPLSGLDTSAMPTDEKKARGNTAVASLARMTKMKTEKVERTPEEEKKRRDKLQKIYAYMNHPQFKQYLIDMGFQVTAKGISKKSDQHIEEFLNDIKAAINAKNTSGVLSGTVFTVTGIVEGITQKPTIKPRIDLLGWTDGMRSNQAILDTMAEIELEYSLSGVISPEKRLAMMMFKSAGLTATLNAQKNAFMKQVAAMHADGKTEAKVPAVAAVAAAATPTQQQSMSLQPGVQAGSTPKEQIEMLPGEKPEEKR